MKKTNETDSLNELILLKEQQYDTDFRLLKEQLHIAYESIKPVNLIKNIVHDVAASPEIKKDVTSNILGLVTGFISKKIVVGDSSHSMLKKLFGTLIQVTVGNTVAKHTDDIKAVGSAFLDYFIKKK